jgi:ATP-dependent Clp protease ATP-binding subunit ClpA
VFERFTEHARQVVVLAQDEARRLRHNYIGTEHILLGLLREEEGLARRVLESLGLQLEGVRAQVAQVDGRGDEMVSGQVPFTPRAKKVLDLALREALSLSHNYIGTEHILLGLVRENEGVAARILLDFDADAEKIRNEIMRWLSGPPPEQATQTMRLRLSVMDAYVLAVDQRDEVMHAVGQARDRDEARKSLARLLGITEQQASEVLEMRLARFNQSDVAEIRTEHKSISDRLDQTEE